jgi:hypothetical protein
MQAKRGVYYLFTLACSCFCFAEYYAWGRQHQWRAIDLATLFIVCCCAVWQVAGAIKAILCPQLIVAGCGGDGVDVLFAATVPVSHMLMYLAKVSSPATPQAIAR